MAVDEKYRESVVARLALAMAGEDWLGTGQISVPVDRRLQAATARQLNATVLTMKVAAGTGFNFVGEGRVAALMAHDDGALSAILNPYRSFGAGLPAEGFDLGHVVRRDGLQLSDAEFAQVVASARDAVARGALAETPDADLWSLDRYVRLHDEVLQRYDYRCAVTGQGFAPAGRPHPDLRIVAMRPRDMGGPLEADNFLPMVPAAEAAWRQGDFSISADYTFIVVLGRIAPQLLAALSDSGRVHLPEDPLHWPDRHHLAYHRSRILGAVPRLRGGDAFET